MEFQRINRTDPERIFVVAKNSWSTASLAANQWVAWDTVTDQDGVGVTKPDGVTNQAQTLNAVAGVAVETIATGDYGLIQVYGFRDGARCSAGSGMVSSKISLGTRLYIKTSGFACHGLHTLSTTVGTTPYQLQFLGIAMAPSNTAAKLTSATTWVGKVFIRCL